MILHTVAHGPAGYAIGFSDGELVEGDELPVRPDGFIEFYAARPADTQILPKWIAAVQNESNPVRRDSVDLAGLAFKKWRDARRRNEAANSLQDLKDLIADNPCAEVPTLIVAKVPYDPFRPPRVSRRIVGLCAFHRTWSNNIYLDYLCVHPLLYGSGSIRGVGSAMLWYLALIAEHIGADVIWGEATQMSCRFYSHIWRKPIADMIVLTRDEYVAFASAMALAQTAETREVKGL